MSKNKEKPEMAVSFAKIVVGEPYSRMELARLWGYASFHALARGVVTPKSDNKIILFVTQEKQSHSEQYEDELAGQTLYWMGPNDHFAEDRILKASLSADEIHLFFRTRHHQDFFYEGRLEVLKSKQYTDRPSLFVFRLSDAPKETKSRALCALRPEIRKTEPPR